MAYLLKFYTCRKGPWLNLRNKNLEMSTVHYRNSSCGSFAYCTGLLLNGRQQFFEGRLYCATIRISEPNIQYLNIKTVC